MRVREEVRVSLWRRADELRWAHLSPFEKATNYEAWTRELAVGGVLARYMDKGRVRVYIKDTLLKDYTRQKQAGEAVPLRELGIDPATRTVRKFTKPHGRLFADGRVIAWGRAEDWKLVLTTLYERAHSGPGASAHGAVLFGASGRWAEPSVQALVEDVARRLGIGLLVWHGSS